MASTGWKHGFESLEEVCLLVVLDFWGRPWHLPSPPAVTIREPARRYAVAAGRPPIKLIQMPRLVMRTAGLIMPIARERAEMDYQWYAPFHMDATETADTFRLTVTDLDSAVRNEVG
ncbi:hypothetical protein ACH4E5_31310 [Streptomyces afghaniensis]|uniref:hypothetical protein n=1 Tax=Streptomyces afghaniensis TaxID=66865 RepID=UPI0037A28379